MNRYFSKEEMQMADNHVKICSTLLIIREMQIKITMRFHLTPQTDYHQKNTHNKYFERCGEKRTPCTLLVGMEIAAVTVENRMEVFHKIKARPII